MSEVRGLTARHEGREYLRKPRLLDLFCGAGGAARGYSDAGFDVVGVDIKPQPRYPFEFIQADALSPSDYWGDHFDAIHASPPCQAYTAYRRKGHGVGDGYPDLVFETRELLIDVNLPYVIENVPGAPLMEPFTLCGSMFGLDVRRHRWFEVNWALFDPPQCNHAAQEAKGKRFPGATNRSGRYTAEIGVYRIPLGAQKRAMGLWAPEVTLGELSEMVPPAYTRWIGERLHYDLYMRNAA